MYIAKCFALLFRGEFCHKPEPALVNPSMFLSAHHTLAHHTHLLSGVTCLHTWSSFYIYFHRLPVQREYCTGVTRRFIQLCLYCAQLTVQRASRCVWCSICTVHLQINCNCILCCAVQFSSLSCMHFQAELWLYCPLFRSWGFSFISGQTSRMQPYCRRFSVYSRFSRVRRIYMYIYQGLILV